MKGLLLVSSLAPISIKCALVLNISAGKAMKLPKGKFLIFFIICGTLLYVGIVLVTKYADISFYIFKILC